MIIEDIIREQNRLRSDFDGLIKPEMSHDLISPFLSLPGLVGFWPMSSVQRSTGNAYDLSGQNRTLTYNGNPTYNIYGNKVAYLDLDGTGDYLSRADETDLDVLGSETIFASGVRGLTVGGWFWFNNKTNSYHLMSKNNATGNQRGFQLLYSQPLTAMQAVVSVDGINNTTLTTGADITAQIWYFMVMKFEPSTRLSLTINGTKYSTTSSIPASIFNNTASFIIGANGNISNLLQGRASLCFLCANAVPDEIISSLYQTRGAFGV